MIELVRRLRPVEELLEALQSDEEEVRSRARQMLALLWREQAGEAAMEEVEAGLRLLENRMFQEAVEHFSQLIEQFPAFAEAYRYRGEAWYRLGRYRESILDLLQALKRNPHHYEAWADLGRSFVQMGLYRNALTAFRRALQIDPYAAELREYIAYCRQELAGEGSNGH
ncbi:MAG: hypothetical protein KatS3mg115_0277 [Candidatus Poribacteria bacterium]|nr:MAG: hypothetical protein KatS3mg115_0277 [Candidatus Poribacteria bacterium]